MASKVNRRLRVSGKKEKKKEVMRVESVRREDGDGVNKLKNGMLFSCEGFLKFSPELAGIIKTDSKVVDSIRNQMPILARHPQADAAAAVGEIATRIEAQILLHGVIPGAG